MYFKSFVNIFELKIENIKRQKINLITKFSFNYLRKFLQYSLLIKLTHMHFKKTHFNKKTILLVYDDTKIARLEGKT